MAILEPTSAEEATARRAQAKRLDRDALGAALSKLEGGDHRLLVAVTDPDRLEATALEKKLLAAGASTSLVDRAKQFRALAAIRVAEERGRSLFDEYMVLLTATGVPSADPVHQADWKDAFRVAWLVD